MAKKIIIFILILIVILAGAYTYLYFMGGDDTSIPGTERIKIRDLFPFGSPEISENPPQVPSENTEIPPSTTPPQLRQVFNSPTAGSGIFTTSSSTIIRFVERSTGNVYEAYTDTTSIKRISNTTIPKVVEAMFTTPNTVIMRYVNADGELIETIYGTLSTSTQISQSTSTPILDDLAQIQTTFLFPNIKEFVVSPNKSAIFYTTLFSGGIAGIQALPNGNSKTAIFESPLKEWRIEWPTSTVITLTTKASSQSGGHLYFLNPNTGAQKHILQGEKSFATHTNPNGSLVLYTQSSPTGVFTLHTLDTSTSSTTNIAIQPTLPEKCVWSKNIATVLYCAVPFVIPPGEYPDMWYQGLVSFSDRLWKINTQTGQTELLADLKQISGRDLDMIDLSLDSEETFILFRNKTDLTLWSYTF